MGTGERFAFSGGKHKFIIEGLAKLILPGGTRNFRLRTGFDRPREATAAWQQDHVQEGASPTNSGPTLPVAKVDVKSRMVRMQWPPKRGMPIPISPEAESADYYGPMQRADQDGVSIAVSQRDPQMRGLHSIVWLPKPFEELLPCGAGMDTLNGQEEMTQIVGRSAGDPEGALQAAKDAAAGYFSDGQTTQQLAWFLPIFSKEGAQVALDHASLRLDLPMYKTAEEATQSSAWRHEMGKLVPVRRAWGVLGLMWTLLIDQLEEGRQWQACERCGRFFSGKRGKRFCGAEDNKVCFRERRAADRRTERMRRSPTTQDY